jgi:NAD(P)-dependent dehydrogenase (short-subunit alcohol dehydrogenase family)
MAGWSAHEIPDRTGHTALVTGANSGIGLVTARELARHGARVLLACRSSDKGRAAATAIRTAVPAAQLEIVALDLASLDSVRACARAVAALSASLDLLVNNAGVMATPLRRSADGFELQIATNHLGHFALTGLLLDRLRAAAEPRVVTVSSLAHRRARIDLEDLNFERRRYNNWLAYGQSKLANLLFCFELARRATATGWKLRSLAAHPGYAATHLQTAGPARWYERLAGLIGNLLIAQSAEMGALPTLYAAVADLPSGTFVGPGGPGEIRGRPRVVSAAARAYDEPLARRLWELSERLTGVRYEFGAPGGGACGAQ